MGKEERKLVIGKRGWFTKGKIYDFLRESIWAKYIRGEEIYLDMGGGGSRQVTPFIGLPLIGQGVIGQYRFKYGTRDNWPIPIFSPSSVKRHCNTDIFKQNFMYVFSKSTNDTSSIKNGTKSAVLTA
jgi:hypothetical protein